MQRFKYSSLTVCFVFAIAFGADSCVSHDLQQYSCDSGTVGYQDSVKPIVQTKCALDGCHNGTNHELPNWTDFSTFQNRASDVKRRILAHEMPPSNSPAGGLSHAQINAIACWVDQGAQNN
jgi:hypothetical protein